MQSIANEMDDCNTQNLIVSCLNQQISEFELLKSMYPDNSEIVLTDKNILDEINNFLANVTDSMPNHLEFTLYIVHDRFKLELCINLPSLYPTEEPDIYLRCNQMNGQQETSLNAALNNYIKNNLVGEVCLYTAILWLQENLDTYSLTEEQGTDNNCAKSDELQLEDTFARLWIYSHHIYNKKKREEILRKAKEFNLGGFCLPGKPGIICIEGSNNDCQVWWRHIKAMNWKKIVVRKTEIFDASEQSMQKKFEGFKEISFQNKNTTNSKHADMGGLSKFLSELGLHENFNEVFGINET